MAASILFMVTLHGTFRFGGDQQFVLLASSVYILAFTLASNPAQPVD